MGPSTGGWDGQISIRVYHLLPRPLHSRIYLSTPSYEQEETQTQQCKWKWKWVLKNNDVTFWRAHLKDLSKGHLWLQIICCSQKKVSSQCSDRCLIKRSESLQNLALEGRRTDCISCSTQKSTLLNPCPSCPVPPPQPTELQVSRCMKAPLDCALDRN